MREYNKFNFKRKKRDNINNQIIKEKKVNNQMELLLLLLFCILRMDLNFHVFDRGYF